jgi:hypothetical protein
MTSPVSPNSPFLDNIPEEIFQKIVTHLHVSSLLRLRVTNHKIWRFIGFNDPRRVIPNYIVPILNQLPKRCLGRAQKRGALSRRGSELKDPCLCTYAHVLPRITTLHRVVNDITTYRLWKKIRGKGIDHAGEGERFKCRSCHHMKISSRQITKNKRRTAGGRAGSWLNVQDIVVVNNISSEYFDYFGILQKDLETFFERPNLLVRSKQRYRVIKLTNELASEFLLKELYLLLRLLTTNKHE